MGTILIILLVVLAFFVVVALVKAIFWIAVIGLAVAAAAVAWRRWGKPALGSVT